MLPEKYQKRSFRRFRVPIDSARLLAEFNSIPDSAWQSSYWGDVHCSVGMLLLRGGSKGTEADFYSANVQDSPLLADLEYIKSLLDRDGPFGGAHYAFLFRMEPNGVTKIHRDLKEEWKSMFRIHVPVRTNPKAMLYSDGYWQHFAAGSAWSFDNYSEHGVVNGSTERIHLIMDVVFNPKLAAQIDRAEFIKGKKKPELVKKILEPKQSHSSYPGDEYITNTVSQLHAQGHDDAKIADAFNKSDIPTKHYVVKNKKGKSPPWTEAMISEIRSRC